MLPHGKCTKTPQQLHDFPTSLQNLCATSFGSLPHMATQNIFSTILLLTFLALAFTVLNLLLLGNLNFPSSMLLSWLSVGHQTVMRVFYVTPALRFWFIVVFSVFHLFSSLDRFSPIPTKPTPFHQQLQAWIESMRVTCFGGTTCCGFHPKYPLKFHQDSHWMTCRPPQLPQPPPSFLTLLLMAWTCWTHALRSWIPWLLY